MAGADLPIADSCSLDSAGGRAQGRRYEELARQVIDATRSSRALTVRFGAGLNEELLRETVAVERECCPFIAIDYDSGARTLSLSVDEERREPTLDAIESVLA